VKIWKEQGWDLNGFIAPGWLMPDRQDALLKKMGFSYTTRLREVISLQSGVSVTSQSLCYSTRSWWRRPVSRLWNHWLYNKLQGNEVIRLSMHPNDLHCQAIRDQIASLVQMTLANGYQPLSYSDYVSR
jgi:predicted deacetylase